MRNDFRKLQKMLTCKFCDESIIFDDYHVSQKSGKKIPLDPDNYKPHRCEESLNAWRKEHPLICQYCHDVQIYFNDSVVSSNGKRIPIEVDTDEPHNCPNNPYHTNKGRDCKS
jgi:hypothetical protein